MEKPSRTDSQMTPLTTHTICPTYSCPNCGRDVNFRIKKCACGMEFK